MIPCLRFPRTQSRITLIVAFLTSSRVVRTENIWWVFRVKPPNSNSPGVLRTSPYIHQAYIRIFHETVAVTETVSGNHNHIHQLRNEQLHWLTDELGICPTAPHAPRMSKEQHWDEARRSQGSSQGKSHVRMRVCHHVIHMLAFSSLVRILKLYRTSRFLFQNINYLNNIAVV